MNHPSTETTHKEALWQRGDRVMAMASGGAALGAMIGQVPGALIGAILAGVYGWQSGAKSKSTKAGPEKA
jgi:uncharacterized membrane protein